MIPIYRSDPYCASITTIVDSIIDEGETQLLTCREQLFTEGGGQPGDYGKIIFAGEERELLALVKHKGDTRLKVSSFNTLRPGDAVNCHLDTARRLQIMRLHTAQHALAGAIRRICPDYQSAGMRISAAAASCSMRFYSESFNGDLAGPLAIFEESVRQALKVEAHLLESVNHALERFGPLYRPSDKGVQIKGKVRVVVIEGLDANACGGTHVRDLGEVGAIAALSAVRAEDGCWETDFSLIEETLLEN